LGTRITTLLGHIRAERGHLFVGRLYLRVRAPLYDPELPDHEEHERELIEVCRELGYELPLHHRGDEPPG
jgi:hypothetical protein